jgi:hypothetical protein
MSWRMCLDAKAPFFSLRYGAPTAPISPQKFDVLPLTEIPQAASFL